MDAYDDDAAVHRQVGGEIVVSPKTMELYMQIKHENIYITKSINIR